MPVSMRLPATWCVECRLGTQRKVGAWSEEEVLKLREAVEEYLVLKKASYEQKGLFPSF